MFKIILIAFGFSALCAAFPTHEIIIRKLDHGPRYQYAPDSNGQIHLVDLWMPLSDLYDAASFDPDVTNVYHLFTRTNPLRSQPLTYNDAAALAQSNYDANRRTILLIHGWMNSATSDFNQKLVTALLAAEDLNVLVMDWSIGSNSLNYRLVNLNAVRSGEAAARFINWLNQQTGSNVMQYHLIGHGVGGHQAGIIGRTLGGRIPYITGLNPSLIGWVNNVDRFSPTDAIYTEVIHTNYIHGYLGDLGQTDFWFNGGISMPGCDSNECDHDRSYLYFAESIRTGGFTGKQCLNYYAALLNMCNFHPGRLQMGGLKPKAGKTGIYYVETNANPPYSKF